MGKYCKPLQLMCNKNRVTESRVTRGWGASESETREGLFEEVAFGLRPEREEGSVMLGAWGKASQAEGKGWAKQRS